MGVGGGAAAILPVAGPGHHPGRLARGVGAAAIPDAGEVGEAVGGAGGPGDLTVFPGATVSGRMGDGDERPVPLVGPVIRQWWPGRRASAYPQIEAPRRRWFATGSWVVRASTG